MKLESVEAIVLKNLKEYPESRADDNYLYCLVCLDINKDILDIPFSEVMANSKKYGLPSPATVSRCRRKIFIERPELNPNLVVRKEREMEIKEYVKK